MNTPADILGIEKTAAPVAWTAGKSSLVEALVGAVLGAAAGGATGAGVYKPKEQREWTDDEGKWWRRSLTPEERKARRQAAALGAVLGAGTGAAAGLGVRHMGLRHVNTQAAQAEQAAYDFVHGKLKDEARAAALAAGRYDSPARGKLTDRSVDNLLQRIGDSYLTAADAAVVEAASRPYGWALARNSFDDVAKGLRREGDELVGKFRDPMVGFSGDFNKLSSYAGEVDSQADMARAVHEREEPNKRPDHQPETNENLDPKPRKKRGKKGMRNLSPKTILKNSPQGTDLDLMQHRADPDRGEGPPPGTEMGKMGMSINGKNLSAVQRLRKSFSQSKKPTLVGMPKVPKPSFKMNTKDTVQTRKLQGSL